MADDSLVVRNVNWREVFPFTHLFRAFRVAVHPSKLVLGLLLIISFYLGGRILDAIWPSTSKANYDEVTSYEQFRWRHNPADSFAVERDRVRQTNTENYATRLMAEGIVTDPAAAHEAARHGQYLSELVSRVISARNESIKAAESARQDELKAAEAEKDEAVRARRVRDTNLNFNSQMRAAEQTAAGAIHELYTLVPRGLFDEFFSYEVRQVGQIIDGALAFRWGGGLSGAQNPSSSILDVPPGVESRGRDLIASMQPPGVIASLSNFLIVGPGWLLTNHIIYFILLAALFLLVWAVFGGAIARIAAVHVARDEKISVRQALGFSLSKVLSFIFAPVIPMGIILGLGVVLAIGGLLFYVPWIGPIVAGVLFGLALIAGFVMTLVALGTIGGFNLMYPTVAVEGSDSFDAISRSFSYVFARPWRMVFYTIVALIYGGICYLFVRFFIYVMLSLTHFFVSWWLVGQPGRYFPEMWPTLNASNLIFSPQFAGLKWSEAIAAGFICLWVYLVICLLGAFAISFYFSANTIIYYLMRREVDATELDDVYVEETEEEFGEAPPVSGAPGEPAPASAAAPPAPGAAVVGDIAAPAPAPSDAPSPQPPSDAGAPHVETPPP